MSERSRLWDENEERCVQFLLGTLSDEEQGAVEDRMLADADFHEELLAASDELIRAYLAGKLSAEDHTRFENHFLASGRRRERYVFIRALVTTVRQELGEGRAAPVRSGARPPVRPMVWAVAASLVIGLGLWWVRTHQDVPRVAGPPLSPSPRAPIATSVPVPTISTAPQVARSDTPRPSRQLVEERRRVRLPAEASDAVEVALALGTKHVQIEVPIQEGLHPTYDVEIRPAGGGDPIWAARALMPRRAGEPLVLDVPARVLVADAYELRVDGERLRNPPPGGGVSLRYSLRIAHAH